MLQTTLSKLNCKSCKKLDLQKKSQLYPTQSKIMPNLSTIFCFLTPDKISEYKYSNYSSFLRRPCKSILDLGSDKVLIWEQ